MNIIKHLLKFSFQVIGRDLVIIHQAGEMKNFAALGDQVATE